MSGSDAAAGAGLARFVPCETIAAWQASARAVERPEDVIGLPEDEFEPLFETLAEQRVVSAFIDRVVRSDALASAPVARREALERRQLMHQALAAVVCEQVVEVVSMLIEQDLRPVPLKGAALAYRFYAEPHLRPFADIDLLFLDRGEAVRAAAVLRSAGYRPKEETRGGDPWLWSRHLPELHHPDRLLHVECHGSLLRPPRDKRQRRERVLLDDMERFRYGACDADILSGEASIVYTLAHAFVRHGGEPVALAVLLDVDTIARQEGATLDWHRLIELASSSGLAASTAVGLMACRALLATPMERSVESWCSSTAATTPRLARSGRAQRVRSAGHLSGILHADSLGGALSMAVFSTFPKPAFMRWRYPEMHRWPLPALYPWRWVVQAGKLVSLFPAGGRVR